MRIDIWQDNYSTDNYKLFFEADDQSKKPDKIVLSGRDDDKNLSPNKWEFEIVDKTYIDSKNDEQDNRLTAIETHNEQQDTRLDDIEQHNSEQERRLDAIDILNSEQNNRLTVIESHNERQDVNISNLNLLIENSNGEIEILKARKNVFERDIDIPTDILNEINSLNDGTYQLTGDLTFYNTNNIGSNYSIGGILLKTEDNVTIDCFHVDFGGLNEFESIRVSCYTQKGLVNNLEGLVSFLTSSETMKEFHHASLTNLNFSELVTAPKKKYTKNMGISLNFTENTIRNVQLTPYIYISDDRSDFYLFVDSTFDIIDIGSGKEPINFINGIELPNGLSISDYFCGNLCSQFVRGDSPSEFDFGVFLGDFNNSIFDVRVNPMPPSSNYNRLQLTAHFIKKGE